MFNFFEAYKGLLQPWQINATISIAKRFGVEAEDLHDVMQETAMRLVSFKYDAAKSNGATERSAVSVIIRNVIMTMQLANTRYQRRIEKYSQENKQREGVEQDVGYNDYLEVIAGLDEVDQDIAHALSEGKNINEIAREKGISWYSVNRSIERIRLHFLAQG